VPKKRVTSEQPVEEYPDVLSGWQATGPSLAVAAQAAFGGLGTLLGAVILTPVIGALVRLRSFAPGAASVSDLVAATLGRRAGTFAAIVQTMGYAVLAAIGAQAVGHQLTVYVIDDPATLTDSWLWPLYSVAALVVIAWLAFALPGRIVAGLAAVLGGVGLLIYFYLALAVIASVFSGTAPVDVSGEHLPTGLATVSALAVLAVGLVGFDVVTTRNREVRSLGRPMTLAIGVVTLVALLVWYADHVGGAGELRLSARQFGFVVLQMYPGAGVVTMAVGVACVAIAVVLALMWAIVRLVERVKGPIGPEYALAVLLALMAMLVVARCRDWLGIHEATNYVGEILLVVTYAVVVEASARIPGDSTLIWWSRILVPGALATVVLLPVVNSRFAVGAVWPLVIVAGLVGVAAAVSISDRREAAD
jgi:hypothetical protein